MVSNIKNKILINKKNLIIVFFLGLIPNAYATIDSNSEQGSLHVDSATYEIIHHEQIMIKIYGTVNEIHEGNRLIILINLPDGLTTGQLIILKSNGYFETFFIIDEDSQIGKYNVLATYGRSKLGEINFEVKEKKYSPEELLSAREILGQVKAQKDEQKAAEQKAAEQKAAEQKAAEQKAAEQKAAEQKAAEQKAAEQKAAEQKAAEQKAAEQKAAEQKAAEQKAAEQKAAEQKAAEQKAETIQKDKENSSYSGVIILMTIVAGIIVLRKMKKKRKKQSPIISHTKSESKQDYREVKDETENESEWRGI